VSEYTLKNAVLPLCEDYEVIVCGGGPAGCAAAAAAAREGARTLLLESSGMLGGMATGGMVNAFTPMTDEVNILYGGIAKKVIAAARDFLKITLKKPWGWVPIDYENLKVVYDDLVTGAGAQVLFHSQVCGVEMKDDRNIDVVLVANKSGLTAYRARVFIDCTGDADLYAWAGQEYAKGNENGDLQGTSLCFAIAGIHDEAFRTMNDPWYDGTGYKNRALLNHIMREGKYRIENDHWVPQRVAPGIYHFNAGHVFGVDSTKPETVTRGIMEGRKLARTFHDAFSEYAPEAFGDSYLMATAPTLGIRESRIIQGDYTFTVEDYLARRSFPDEIYRGKYNIDVHEETKDATHNTEIEYEHYGPGESYGVPYRCLCPRGLDNVLVAGRTICSDRISNGSLRIMPSCLSAGEAAGIAAKLALDRDEVNIHTVDTDRLRQRLKEEGTYLP